MIPSLVSSLLGHTSQYGHVLKYDGSKNAADVDVFFSSCVD